jgi:hypothetical protein
MVSSSTSKPDWLPDELWPWLQRYRDQSLTPPAVRREQVGIQERHRQVDLCPGDPRHPGPGALISRG